jgi:hypothetical protein
MVEVVCFDRIPAKDPNLWISPTSLRTPVPLLRSLSTASNPKLYGSSYKHPQLVPLNRPDILLRHTCRN